jgi:crotonobetainyl-CoA:carnitine CoA-transferase CaiB-like acyl-CoA transferase
VRPGGNQGYNTACIWAVEATMAAVYASQTLGVGQLVDVSMHAASNVSTEAATYEWLVARATVERQTFRHAAVRPTPPRLIVAGDGGYVIVAPPRYTAEFRALAEWTVELGIAEEVDEFFFVEMGVERGGILLSEVDHDPIVAAIYQAGNDCLRALAARLPAKEFFVNAQRRGLPVGMLFAPEDVMEDEHFIERGFPVEIYHEDFDQSFRYPGAPFHSTASPWRTRWRAPHVGEHTETVLDAHGLRHQ